MLNHDESPSNNDDRVMKVETDDEDRATVAQTYNGAAAPPPIGEETAIEQPGVTDLDLVMAKPSSIPVTAQQSANWSVTTQRDLQDPANEQHRDPFEMQVSSRSADITQPGSSSTAREHARRVIPLTSQPPTAAQSVNP